MGWTALVLALVLAFVFRRSFETGQILFSNDGPLGAISSQADDHLGAFSGFWQPLNWIGFQAPSALPSITNVIVLLTTPVSFSKLYAPFSIFFIGLAAAALFYRLGFSLIVCVFGALATALNTDYFSYACWGLGSLPLCVACAFFALAAICDGRSWAWPALAGLCVGMGILEGFDSGAIMSLYIAAFVLFRFFVDEVGEPQKRLLTGVAKLAVVVIFSVFMAAQALSTLIGTQISGIAGAAPAETAAAKEQNWNFATQWSLPKIETLRVIIPGLYGYRMDTPDGGNYWGTVGMPAGWETHHMGPPRFSGAGFYIGIVVLLFAAYALIEAFRKDSALTPRQRAFVKFWAVAALLSLLFAFGRFAPFYRFVYALPYFSTIRNPVKFMHPFSLSMVILFGYGLHAVLARSAARATQSVAGLGDKVRNWWQSAKPPERRWTWGCATFAALILLGLLVFTSSAREMTSYMQSIAIPPSDAPKILKFSQQEIVWSLAFLLAGLTLFILFLSGYFGGQRLKLGLGLFAAVLVTDMVRANTPWVVYLDYRENYASNAIIEFLRKNPHEYRVATKFHPFGGGYFAASDGMASVFGAVLNFWSQHLFQYYRIQSPDIIQMPREPELDKSFAQAFSPRDLPSFNLLGRLWQLSNTRYVLADKTFRIPANPPTEVPTSEFLNRFISPDGSPFNVVTNFDIVPKGASTAAAEDFTAVVNPNGRFSLYEFTGALPRALLFNSWQVNTNDQSTLLTLTQTNFNPHATALTMSPAPFAPSTNNPGTATITTYKPRFVEISADVKSPALLALFDRYDPLWTVTVDGKKENLVRTDYIFRGVYLTPGTHTVQFTFSTPLRTLYVSLAAIVVAIGLCFYVAFRPERDGS